MKNLTPHLWSSTLVAMRPSPTLEENPCREYQVLRAEFGEMSPRGLSNDLTESKTNVKAIINNFMDNSIENADAVFLNRANASTVRITDKFKLTVVFVDETSRFTRMETRPVLALFNP